MSASERIAFFGKLPAYGDFVRSPGDQVLVELMDQWLASVMQRLSGNPRWRQHYDACPPLEFAFAGTRTRQVVSARLLASSDQSARRFPFACMAVYQVAKPREFLPCSPLALAPSWDGLAAATACSPARPAEGLPAAQMPENALVQEQLERYLADACLASLEAELAIPAGAGQVRRMLLAAGLLLRPLLNQAPVPARCLALPLPQDAALRRPAAAFWMTLLAPVLARQDLELAIFMAPVAGRPALVLGLDGADPAVLQAIIDPDAARDGMVVLDDCAWVEDALHGDAPLQRLSACLEQGQLGLPVAIQLFQETFR